METVKLELIGEVNMYLGMGIQTVTAIILGGLIGYEREAKNKAAGIKTNMLICIGACLFTSVSFLNHATGTVVDPNRMAAQVVSGIGFLGAGAIIQSRGNIMGLTTAASIWVVSAIGVTIGSGYPIVAAIFTITALVVLRLISPLYKLLYKNQDSETHQVKILSKGSVKKVIHSMIYNAGLTLDEIWEDKFDRKKNEYVLTVILNIHPRRLEQLKGKINNHFQIMSVSSNIYNADEEGFDEDEAEKAS